MAICGSPELLAKAREEFFKRKRDEKVYMVVLENIANGHVKEMINCIDLNESMEKGSWKDIMALICTYAKMDEFASLCGLLGQKLEQKVSQGLTHNPKDTEDSKLAAVLCYLAAGELDKVVEIWLSDENIAKYTLSKPSEFSEYADKIQELVERVTILRKAISFIDTEFVNNAPEKNGQFALHKLYEKYAEYAEVLVSQGKLDEAWTFLELIPESFQFWGTELVQSLRDRIFRNGNYSVPDGRQPPQPPYEVTDITYVPPPQPQQPQQQMNYNSYMATNTNTYGNQMYTPSYSTTNFGNTTAGITNQPYSTNNLYYNQNSTVPTSQYSSYSQPSYNNVLNNTMTSTNTMNVSKPAPPLYGNSTTSTANMYDNSYSKPNIPQPVAQESIANSLTSPVPPPSTINKQPSAAGGFHDPPKVEFKRSPYVPYSTLNQPRAGTYSNVSPYTAPATLTSPLQPASTIPNNNTTGYNSTATTATTTTARNDFTPPPLPNIYGLTSSSGFNSLPTISNSLNGNPLPESKPAVPQNTPPMMGQTQPSMYGMMNSSMNPVAPPKPVEEPPAKLNHLCMV